VRKLLRPAGTWLASWALLFWLWLAYVGEWNRIEWIAAACAAAVGATAALVVVRQGLLRFRPELEWILRARSVPLQVLVDFWIVSAALVRTIVRRRPVRGTFRANAFPAGGDDPRSAFRRACVTTLTTYSPNAYVIDVDAEAGTVLLHDLVPNRRSEEPA
jgi:hypothetical protein